MMKIYYTGEASGPVSISFNGRDYQNVSLDALKEGYELPQSADYSKIRIQGSNATLKNINILKQIKVDDVHNEFKIAVGQLSENAYPVGGIAYAQRDWQYYDASPHSEYSQLLDNGVLDLAKIQRIYEDYRGTSIIYKGAIENTPQDTYIFLRDSDYFSNQSYAYNIMNQICTAALEGSEGLRELFEANIDSLDLVFHNTETGEYTSYIKIESDNDWNTLKEKYDIYLAKVHVSAETQEVTDYAEIPSDWSVLMAYEKDGQTVYIITKQEYQYWGGDAKYGDSRYAFASHISPICKVGKLDQTQDYSPYHGENINIINTFRVSDNN